MCDTVREANQRIVPSRCGVEALGISGRQPVKNFHLGTHKPIPFRMGEPYARPALARNRVDHVLFDSGDHCLEIFLEMWTQHVELRCISNELRWSSRPGLCCGHWRFLSCHVGDKFDGCDARQKHVRSGFGRHEG